MIDEKVLIERLMIASAGCRVYKLINPNIEDVTEFNAYKKCIEIVKDLASEHNNGWISVEDALPEEYMDVLGYGQEGHTYLVRLYESKIFGKVWQQWNGGDMRFDWIIAWQPIPERPTPYQKGE